MINQNISIYVNVLCKKSKESKPFNISTTRSFSNRTISNGMYLGLKITYNLPGRSSKEKFDRHWWCHGWWIIGGHVVFSSVFLPTIIVRTK